MEIHTFVEMILKCEIWIQFKSFVKIHDLYIILKKKKKKNDTK